MISLPPHDDRSIENMPSILKYLGYIAVHKYAVEILVANEFSGLAFGCKPNAAGTGITFFFKS